MKIVISISKTAVSVAGDVIKTKISVMIAGFSQMTVFAIAKERHND